MHSERQGSLACVGLGMMLGAHLTPRSRHTIEHADVVFVLASDGLVERWVEEMHPDVRSLQPYYSEGRSRRATYAEMVGAIVAEVRAGRRVCAAFYGHPGVFAQVAHEAIERVRGEGIDARMEPGISAEDCLYADIGIDPGRTGCQHFEATQFLCCDRQVDTAAWLVLWQVASVGDRSFARNATGRGYRQLLVDKLARVYAPQYEVVLYEAPTIATGSPRIERLPLGRLADARLNMHTTLAVGPARPLRVDLAMRAALDALDALDAGPSPRPRVRPRLELVRDVNRERDD
ncbi:SAM-dependent methyltransferase [Cognatilysobacter segetis]|uniref:SAM-dependent methyltransferase n=1 Tax=Cognatilysobacter segetis TaxID=2492394 RepID=UPI00192E5144|nr:SAM-dependent methyltransferase [Lysobacter segetis]